MSNFFTSPYNIIETPEPIFAGSSYDFAFDIKNPFSDEEVDLSIADYIEFKITLFGNYNDDVVLRVTSKDAIGNIHKVTVDKVKKSWLNIHLFSEDTENFEDSTYDYQIKLFSVNGLDDKVIGRGKISVFKEL